MLMIKRILRNLLTFIKNLCIVPLGVIIWIIYRAYLQALFIEQKLDKLEKGKK